MDYKNPLSKFAGNSFLIKALLFISSQAVGFRIFSALSNTPFEMRSRVIYEYTCVGCHSNYIGQTSRHLRHRIAEHEGVSHLTGKVMKSQSHSSIRDHSLLCSGSNCSSRNFKILATGSSDLELLIKERLLITQRKPTLNGNTGSFELLLN